MIPVISPLAQYHSHKGAIQTAITNVLEGGTYILGQQVDAFEREFAEHCGVAYTIGVGSGTDALILTLKALGIGTGDEIITVSHTAVATAAAIVAVGATPVLVEIDPNFYTLEPSSLESAITARTKAIIAVHLYGQAADVDAINLVARRHGIQVIEDCAQAAGGFYNGRRIGTLADVACFSFYPTKNLGAIGDGGMVATADQGLAERVRRLRQYGWDSARRTLETGVNSRLDEIQAAILRTKLPHLDIDNARRRAIADRYDKGLAGLPLTIPARRSDSEHAFHLYVVTCDDRDALKDGLAEAGVGTGIHYASPVHRQTGYREACIVPQSGLPVTEHLVDRILTLPLYPELTDADVDTVVAATQSHFLGVNR